MVPNKYQKFTRMEIKGDKLYAISYLKFNWQ